MRDRTASRHYSPAREEFRREHERRRAWGLVQRHGERLRRRRNVSCTSPPARAHEDRRRDHTQDPSAVPASTPLEQEQRPALSRPTVTGNAPTGRQPSSSGGDPSRCHETCQERPAQPARQGKCHDPAQPAQRPASTPRRHAPAGSPRPFRASPTSGQRIHAIRPRRRSLPRLPQCHCRPRCKAPTARQMRPP